MKDVNRFKELLDEFMTLNYDYAFLQERAYKQEHHLKLIKMDKKEEEIKQELIEMYEKS